MTIICRLMVAEKVERPNQSKASPARPGEYEREHGECQVSGSVAVVGGGRWHARLAVPTHGDQSALLSLDRSGPIGPGAPAVDQMTLVIPSGEIDALVTLLVGLIGHARQEGVL